MLIYARIASPVVTSRADASESAHVEPSETRKTRPEGRALDSARSARDLARSARDEAEVGALPYRAFESIFQTAGPGQRPVLGPSSRPSRDVLRLGPGSTPGRQRNARRLAGEGPARRLRLRFGPTPGRQRKSAGTRGGSGRGPGTGKAGDDCHEMCSLFFAGPSGPPLVVRLCSQISQPGDDETTMAKAVGKLPPPTLLTSVVC